MSVIATDVISWDVSAAMAGAYSANVAVSNQNMQYDQALVATVLTVTLNCTAAVASVSGTPGCFNGNVQWVNGLIAGVGELEGISEKAVALRVKSFVARLAKKPINTEDFDGTAANTALSTALETYLGVPSALIVNNAGSQILCQAISGNNSIEELKRVAQAGLSTLFVGVDGLLHVELWKDNTSPLQITIPDEGVVSAGIQRNDEFPTTRIKIRGGFVWELEAGNQPVSSGKTGAGGGGGGGGGQRPATHTLCMQNAMPRERLRVKKQQLKAKKEDLQNAEIELPNGGLLAEMTTIVDGKLVFDIKPSAPAVTWAKGQENIVAAIRAGRSPDDDIENAAVKYTPGGDDAAVDMKITEMPRSLRRPPRGGGGGGGVPNAGGNKSKDKNADEPVEVQVEITVDDPDLQAQFGVLTEQMENRYTTSRERLALMAVRRFQEIKMQRNAWEVELAYLPCLELDQVVRFTTPITSPGGSQTITGLLTSLNVKYDPAPRAGMNAVIESFVDIGTTTYTLSNLILDPHMRGTGTGTEWDVAETGDGKAEVADGFGIIWVDSGGTALIDLDQTEMAIGGNHTIYFAYEQEAGSSVFTFTVDSPAHSTTKSGTGTYSHSFVADQTTTKFRWAFPGTPGDSSRFRITNIVLSRTVVK